MAGRADRGDDLILVEGQLGVLVKDVLPAFLVQDDGASVGIDGLGQDAQALTVPCWRDSSAFYAAWRLCVSHPFGGA